MLGSQDQGIEMWYRLATAHPVTRAITEFIQRGWPQDIFTYVYREWLRRHTQVLYGQIVTILDQRVEQPKTLLMVATHVGLAHQMAAIKQQLAQDRKIRVVLAVVVTDDSPQYTWAVGGADMIFVPSSRTKTGLERYHHSQNLEPSKYIVAPYPVSPGLIRKVSEAGQQSRLTQAEVDSPAKIQVVIPVSGAAVQLDYFSHLVTWLTHDSQRWLFYIVAKESNYTRSFLSQMGRRGRQVALVTSADDRTVVELYEDLYKKEPVLLEVTKPSEQAFKALVSPPGAVGGVILLFSEPVGRQEYDNIAFLRRHNLIPDQDVQKSLWEGHVTEEAKKELHGWRGLRLPMGGKASAEFISWCLAVGIFKQMLQFQGYQKHEELADNGVEVIWEQIAEYMVES